MATYTFRLTALGRAAVAASIASGAPFALVDLAVGDGGGAAYVPTGDETDLVNERARVPIETVERDGATASLVTISAVLPADEGGFWVREVGVYDPAGHLVAIGNYPPTYKPAVAEGASMDLLVKAGLTVSTQAAITISELSGDFYATRDWARNAVDFIAVISAAVAAPPPAPAEAAAYLIPAAPAGVWAGRAGQLARWRGAEEGWQYVVARNGMVVSDTATGSFLVRRAGAWRAVTATVAEHLAGAADLFATPAGVAAMLAEADSTAGDLSNFASFI